MKKKTSAILFYLILVLCFTTSCSQASPQALLPPSLENGVEFYPNSETGKSKAEIERGEEDLTLIQESLSCTENLPEEPDPTENSSLSLLMVGDILLHTPVENSCLQEDGTYDYSSIFSHTANLISATDLAIVNQEVIIGGKELGISGYPAFNASYEIGDALVNSGFDIVCHATNHALDKGQKGLTNCINYWKENHPEVTVLGIHDNLQSQETIPVFEQNGIRIAILNFTYGTNGIPLPQEMPFAVDYLDEDTVISRIQKAEDLADFTICCPHWGTEYCLTKDSMQEKWITIFAKYGVDLVLGTHPHVIEPIEWVLNKENNQNMLVYYSLGNFVNWTSGIGEGIANRMVGGMAEVTLIKDANNQVTISDYGIQPVICHVSDGPNAVTVYPIEDYNEDLATNNQITSQDPTFSYEYCISLCDHIWGNLWHKDN